jgi:hypothetical protein
MVTIRRELPRTGLAGRYRTTYSRFLHRWPARPLTRSLRVDGIVWEGFGFHAALATLSARSLSTPMAQTKPASSRASAVTIFALGLLLLESAQ